MIDREAEKIVPIVKLDCYKLPIGAFCTFQFFKHGLNGFDLAALDVESHMKDKIIVLRRVRNQNLAQVPSQGIQVFSFILAFPNILIVL